MYRCVFIFQFTIAIGGIYSQSHVRTIHTVHLQYISYQHSRQLELTCSQLYEFTYELWPVSAALPPLDYGVGHVGAPPPHTASVIRGVIVRGKG